MLVQATGGEEYYKELRGPALKRASYCMNRRSDSEKHSPHRKAWGEEFVWGTQEHSFGARALFHIVKPKRSHKFEMVSKVGVWLGRDLDSGEHIGARIEWISDGDDMR